MLHARREDPQQIFITGPGARVPDAWDPHLTVDDLVRRGLLDTSRLDPLYAKGVLHALGERMAHHPQFGDALAAVQVWDELGSAGSAVGTSGSALVGGFVLDAAAADLGRVLLGAVGLQVHGQRDPFTIAHHESAHALTSILLKVDGIDQVVAAIVSAAFHLPTPLQSLRDLTDDHRLAIAEQIGSYGATGAYDDRGRVIASDPAAGRSSPTSLLSELCAEAYTFATAENRASLPLVRGVADLLDAVTGRGAPLAEVINQDLHRNLAANRYIERTRPGALREVLALAPPALRAALESDPDFRWEQENPQEPPAWMLDEVVATTGFDREDCKRHLMDAPDMLHLIHGDPMGNGCITSPHWHGTMMEIARRNPSRLTDAAQAAVREQLGPVVERICADLRAMPLPRFESPLYRIAPTGRIERIEEPRPQRHPRELVAAWRQWARTVDLESIEALPPSWSDSEKDGLRSALRQAVADRASALEQQHGLGSPNQEARRARRRATRAHALQSSHPAEAVDRSAASAEVAGGGTSLQPASAPTRGNRSEQRARRRGSLGIGGS